MTPADADSDILERYVSSLVATARISDRNMRGALGILAALLRVGALPPAGREFLAEFLEGIATGGNPDAIIPARKKARKASNVEIFVDVEKARARLGAGHGDMSEVYNLVSRKRGLTSGTVKKQSSIGRSVVRKTMTANINAGAPRSLVVASEARLLGLPLDLVEKILISTQFDR